MEASLEDPSPDLAEAFGADPTIRRLVEGGLA